MSYIPVFIIIFWVASEKKKLWNRPNNHGGKAKENSGKNWKEKHRFRSKGQISWPKSFDKAWNGIGEVTSPRL